MITFSEDEPVQIKAILVNNITSKKFRHLKRPHARRVIDELRECHLGENERRSANESPSLRATYQLFLSCFFYLLHIENPQRLLRSQKRCLPVYVDRISRSSASGG